MDSQTIDHYPVPDMLTRDEAMHLVAREVAKQRMTDMERKIAENESKTSVALTKIELQVAQVITMIKEQNIKAIEDKKEFKKEIESEFASKIDLERLENKLDQLVLRITVTVGTIVSVGLLVGWLLSAASSVKGIVS